MPRKQVQSPSLRESGQYERALGPGQRFSNALPIARPEGEVRELGKGRLPRRGKAFGVEAQWIGEAPRISMGDELAGQDGSACR